MANEKWSQQEKINEELNESIYLCAISGDTEVGYTNNIINSSKFASANHTHIDQYFGSSGGTISELTVTGNTTLNSVDIDECNIDDLFTNYIESDLVRSKDSLLWGEGANLSIITSVSGDSISLINGGNGYGLISKVRGGVGLGVYSVSGNSAEFGFTDMENNSTTASISRYGTITGRNFVSTGTNKSLLNFADISSLRVGGLQVTGTSFFNGQIAASSANLGTLRMSGSILATGSTPYSITMPTARFDNLYVNSRNMISEDYVLYVSGNTHIRGEASINSLEVTNSIGYTRVNNNLSVNGIIYPGSEIESTGDTTGSIVITNGGLGLSGNINGVRIHSRVLGGNTIGRNIWIGGGGNLAVGSVENSQYGKCNTSLGDSSLKENTIGYNNSAIGTFALEKNISGNNNCSFGFGSMSRNTVGSNNTAIGYQSLKDNTTGNNNTAIGDESLSNNKTGVFNTTIGSFSLNSNNIGNYNTAIGASSLFDNTNGSYNTATGYEALHFNQDGEYNVANGVQALRLNLSGNNNVAIGYNSLYSNRAGGHNIAIGSYAGANIGYDDQYSNTYSSDSIFLGSQSAPLNTGETNQIVIGVNSVGNGSNSVTIGNDSITKTILKGVVSLTTLNVIGETTTNNLTVTGIANLGALAFTGGTLGGMIVTGNTITNSLTVNDVSTLKTLNVTGSTTINTMTATTANLGTTKISGNLTATGLTVTTDNLIGKFANFNSSYDDTDAALRLNSDLGMALISNTTGPVGNYLTSTTGTALITRAISGNAIYAYSSSGDPLKVYTNTGSYIAKFGTSLYNGTPNDRLTIASDGSIMTKGSVQINDSLNVNDDITATRIVVSGVTIDNVSGGTVTSRIFKFAEELLEIDATQNPNAPLGTMFLSRYFLFIKGADGWKKIPLENV